MTIYSTLNKSIHNENKRQNVPFDALIPNLKKCVLQFLKNQDFVK